MVTDIFLISIPFIMFYRICKKMKKKAKCVANKLKEKDSAFGEGKVMSDRKRN